MVFDELPALALYGALLPGVDAVAEFLKTHDLAALPNGRHAIDGDRVYVIVAEDAGRSRKGARLEAHRRYADIQVVLNGKDQIGWRAIDRCRRVTEPYGGDRDIEFFADRPAVWIPLAPGQFLLLLPHDAHAPLAGTGPVKKAVFKIRVAGNP